MRPMNLSVRVCRAPRSCGSVGDATPARASESGHIWLPSLQILRCGNSTKHNAALIHIHDRQESLDLGNAESLGFWCLSDGWETECLNLGNISFKPPRQSRHENRKSHEAGGVGERREGGRGSEQPEDCTDRWGCLDLRPAAAFRLQRTQRS